MTDHDGSIPIEHIVRPVPPWRPRSLLTECGLPVAGHPVITRMEWLAKVKAQGQRRAALSTDRWPSWEEDPVHCLGREVEWFRRWSRSPRRSTFREEVIAIAMLIERHREEFAELLEDQAAIVSIETRRGRAQ